MFEGSNSVAEATQKIMQFKVRAAISNSSQPFPYINYQLPSPVDKHQVKGKLRTTATGLPGFREHLKTLSLGTHPPKDADLGTGRLKGFTLN
jgi:hypothetical protein